MAHSVQIDERKNAGRHAGNEGLYEAAALGLSAFKKLDFQPGGLTNLEIEVRSSITHTLTVQKVHQWLERGVRTPKEAVLKERLRALICQ